MDAYLVTGGAGFIGSHIIRHLTGTGQRVRVLDNFSTGKKENLQGIDGHLEVIEGDIRNLEDVRAAVKGIDYILHLAAQVSVPVFMENHTTTYDINLK
ncbi:MAG TPA: NAD-dependent epimerase/dehydratase family protein, partial [Armatimonadota bacterium]|nr:NAD-dependent epimerase/dehydratase family protein [Armatimonadota bacterium]